MKPKRVTVHDKMQRNYRYTLTEPVGRNFAPEFRPDLTPKEMLALGVFAGKYMTDCQKEFPKSWFTHARLGKGKRDPKLNYFGVDASQPARFGINDPAIAKVDRAATAIDIGDVDDARLAVHVDGLHQIDDADVGQLPRELGARFPP